MRKLFLITLFFTLWIVSCNNEERPLRGKQIQFAFTHTSQESVKGERIKATGEPQSVMVTIQDNDGNIMVGRKELTLYRFGDNFLSLPLTLKASGTSSYRLTEFFVIDSDNKVTHVTPKEGSALAHLVADPLEINFTVDPDKITTVTPEVVAVDDSADVADYGYDQFGFKIIKTISVIFSGFIKNNPNFVLTDAHLNVEGIAIVSGDTTVLWTYQTELKATANTVVLEEATLYRITAIKDGYKHWKKNLTLQQGTKLDILFEQTVNLVDVYVAGYEAKNSFIVATYWKNGTPIALSDVESKANGIFISKGDVYVTGTEGFDAGNANAFYWKNGEKITLTPSGDAIINGADAWGISISGSDIYVIGTTKRAANNSDGFVYVPIYWKNGSMIELPTTGSIWGTYSNVSGEPSYITTNGPDVYISGSLSLSSSSGHEFSYPVLWKNGKLIELPIPTADYNRSRATGIKVSNGDVFVSGIVGKSADPEWVSRQATYWKNDQLYMLGSSLATTSAALELDVADNHVYVAGYESHEGTKWNGKYWKDGEAVIINPEASVNFYSVSVINGVVYLAGDYKPMPPNGIPPTANYWVNGERVQCSTQKSFASSMIVVPRNGM
jgi:hypothetical protein